MVIGLMLASVMTWSQQMDEIRKQFHTIDNEESLKAFIELSSGVDDKKASPYIEAAHMRQAIYTNNPFKKMKFFSKGKNKLEQYINQNPFDIEARYVRALVQSEVPVFLKYNEQLNSDTTYILDNIDDSSLPSYYKEMLKQAIHQLIKNHQL